MTSFYSCFVFLVKETAASSNNHFKSALEMPWKTICHTLKNWGLLLFECFVPTRLAKFARESRITITHESIWLIQTDATSIARMR